MIFAVEHLIELGVNSQVKKELIKPMLCKAVHFPTFLAGGFFMIHFINRLQCVRSVINTHRMPVGKPAGRLVHAPALWMLSAYG